MLGEFSSPPSMPVPRSAHDHVFTALSLAFVFFLLLSIVLMWSLTRNPNMPPESRWVFEMSMAFMGCYALIVLLVLILRWSVPRSRRAFTIALSVVLLPYVPLGTVLGIYGLWKVDKPRVPA
jgi:hypothetical protein